MHPVFEYQLYLCNPHLAVTFGPEGFSLTEEAKHAIKRAAAAHIDDRANITPEQLARVGRQTAEMERVLASRVRDFAAGLKAQELEVQACPH